MAMFDITENDTFDAVSEKMSETTMSNKIQNPSKPQTKKPGIPPAEKDELRILIGSKDLEAKLLKQYKVNYLLELSQEQAKEIKERIRKFRAKEVEKQKETERQKETEKQRETEKQKEIIKQEENTNNSNKEENNAKSNRSNGQAYSGT
jgi:hypothetical protein